MQVHALLTVDELDATLRALADPTRRAVVERLGYREVGWHVDARDWDPEHSAGMVVRDVVPTVVPVRPAPMWVCWFGC